MSHKTPMDGTNSEGDLLVVPAWCDPKMRNFVWDAGTIDVGIFAVGSDSLAYATTEGLMFAGKLSEVRTRWPLRLRPIRGCDLHIGKSGYRLYFARPLPGAPRVRESQVTKVIDALTSEYSEIVQLIGNTLGTAASIGSIIGDLVALPGEFADQRTGQRNGDAVRARLGQ